VIPSSLLWLSNLADGFRHSALQIYLQKFAPTDLQLENMHGEFYNCKKLVSFQIG